MAKALKNQETAQEQRVVVDTESVIAPKSIERRQGKFVPPLRMPRSFFEQAQKERELYAKLGGAKLHALGDALASLQINPSAEIFRGMGSSKTLSAYSKAIDLANKRTNAALKGDMMRLGTDMVKAEEKMRIRLSTSKDD